MNVTGLKFLTNEAKKLATIAIGISKKVVTTCIRIQFNAAVFPFIFAYGGIVYVSKWLHNSDNENTTTLQPPSAVVCGKTRELRNSAISSMIAMNSSKCHNEKNRSKGKSNDVKELDLPDLNAEDKFSKENAGRYLTVASIKMNEFSGRDLLWDIPIISAKAKYFAQCVQEERENDMVEARKALEQHPLEIELPKTYREFKDMKTQAENWYENSEASVIKLDYAETGNVDNCSANNCVDSDSFEEKYRQNEFRSYNTSSKHSPRRRTKSQHNSFLDQDKLTCREISTVNKTLRKIHAVCSKLLGELSNLNDSLSHVISVKEKLANLEFQVDEGKRLLQEVECDRFIMKSKLSALEKLINEEEKFLSGDAFCESGFYESVETTGEL